MATKGKDMAVWGLDGKRLKRRALAMLRWLLDPVRRTPVVVTSALLTLLLTVLIVNLFQPVDAAHAERTTAASASSTSTVSVRRFPKAHHPGKSASSSSSTTKNQTKQQKPDPAATSAHPVDWLKPSEQVDYPDPAAHPGLSLEVSLQDQRVYVRDGSELLYSMYASTGMDDSTPRGSFRIQAERGDHFYNPGEGMGARYYTSFLNHGVFLFHSVPTDSKGGYIKEEADMLGIRPGSHGCIRLTVPDARWIMQSVPTGTPVLIK
ncbi:L,D-transpeptidase [Bifidobacterium sp. B4081]|uniref:L,D-transpeptidase n=1 Tax=unclassified Bifidobacterium TaxID=2608897 RepID=UPI00226A4185|nr:MULTISPECIES: L,D-transpeptidase [unclassified Bifidobacterium]MCX8643508.1 L,D-transpeptidase [Bifidobacterium sp. B4077]MCX8645690.1 L,D-transpeptidase [Bifidobacterium sp. B4081]MCX8669642.1 L,D-transpeptidase [Bifidobacterium sp. B3998]